MNSYNAGCPSNISPSQCYEFFSESFDQFENSSNVFATLTYFENCGVSTCDEGYGFEYWPNGSPSSQPTLINVNGLIPGVDVFSIYYADIDSSGNIWFDYEGEDSTYPYSLRLRHRRSSKPDDQYQPLSQSHLQERLSSRVASTRATAAAASG